MAACSRESGRGGGVCASLGNFQVAGLSSPVGWGFAKNTRFLAIPPTYGNRQLCFYLRGITLLGFTRLS